MTQPPVVYILDDDEGMRDCLRWLFESDGLNVDAFETLAALAQSYDASHPGCLVLDLKLIDESGLDAYDKLRESCIPHPFVMITGFGSVPSAIRALRSGAVDFIEKPFENSHLLECVHRAIERDAEQRLRQRENTIIQARIDSLSPRERRVMAMVSDGMMTKEIARDLGIAVKTVEVHRSNVTKKMGVRSVVQLVNTLNRLSVNAFD